MGGLTGDFDAVLEVSGGTIGRLLAVMHQNGASQDPGPRVPHVANFRIGSPDAPDMPRGSVAAQIGVPRVELIDGSSDRFRAKIDFRARYWADPHSVPLADVVSGTIQADYRLEKIDEGCEGWRELADEYRWLRVMKDQVRFTGDAYNDDEYLIASVPIDIEAVRDLVGAVAADLLATRFDPGPQPFGDLFRRLRCLADGTGPNDSAIAIPIGLDGEPPSGSTSSLETRFLESRDFGIAVGVDPLLGRVADLVGSFVGKGVDYHVHGDAGVGGGLEIDYHVRLESADASWLGPDSTPERGLLGVHLAGSGWASRLYKSGVYDLLGVTINDLRISFRIDQTLALEFDPAAERLTVSALGSPTIAIDYGGPFAAEIRSRAQEDLTSQVQALLGGALSTAQRRLDALTSAGRKAPLLEGLRRIEPAAGLRFDEASFDAEGVAVRGAVTLSRPCSPRAKFHRTDARDGFDAIESWIPGGWVKSFSWTWRFHADAAQAAIGLSGKDGIGPPHYETSDNDYMLRRPHEGPTKFGWMKFTEKPLPGLDGNGSLCLTIKGYVIDPVSGELEQVESEAKCEQYGFAFQVPIEIAPWVPIYDPWLEPELEGPPPEIGIQLAGGLDPDRPSFNTLVLSLTRWDEELIFVLTQGLEESRSVGPGLLVTLVLPAGLLAEVPEVGAKIGELAQELPAPLFAVEDAGGAWSRALALPDGAPGWRLITPDGAIAWVADGLPGEKGLAGNLDERLRPGAPPLPSPLGLWTAIGELIPIQLSSSTCPPVPISRGGLDGRGSKLIFVKGDHELSLVELRRFGEEQKEHPDWGLVAGVVVGVDEEAAQALRRELGFDLALFADPDGETTKQAGVGFSPSRLELDQDGRVTAVQLGVARGEEA